MDRSENVCREVLSAKIVKEAVQRHTSPSSPELGPGCTSRVLYCTYQPVDFVIQVATMINLGVRPPLWARTSKEFKVMRRTGEHEILLLVFMDSLNIEKVRGSNWFPSKCNSYVSSGKGTFWWLPCFGGFLGALLAVEAWPFYNVYKTDINCDVKHLRIPGPCRTDWLGSFYSLTPLNVRPRGHQILTFVVL